MALDLSNLSIVDNSLVENGVWFEFADGAAFKLASVTTPAYRKYLREKKNPYEKAGIELKDKQEEEINLRGFAEHVLIDWRGLEENGKPLKYSPGAAYELLTKYDQITKFLLDKAVDMENYRVKQKEVATGKRKKS